MAKTYAVRLEENEYNELAKLLGTTTTTDTFRVALDRLLKDTTTDSSQSSQIAELQKEIELLNIQIEQYEEHIRKLSHNLENIHNNTNLRERRIEHILATQRETITIYENKQKVLEKQYRELWNRLKTAYQQKRTLNIVLKKVHQKYKKYNQHTD